MDPASTIVAVSSPPGRSLRGIVRVDGPGTFDLLDAVLDSSCPRTRGASVGRLRLGPGQLPVLLLTFPAPHSYTGGDAVEIQLPGNPLLLDRVLALLVRGDARAADPGEFTARAFLSGRMSLTQAEGVAATIAARTDAELAAARLLTGGALGDLARRLADEVAAALALVEAGIDFTDQEDVVAIELDDLRTRIGVWKSRISELLESAVGMEQLAAIPWVVLSGPPNAGKSELFNALLGHDRAVVSRLAGTTRDVLAEPLLIDTPTGPAEIMLVDLAGGADSDNVLDGLMQEAAQAARDRAELILRCVPVTDDVPEISPRELLVITKIDLQEPAAMPAGAVALSAATSRGLHQIRRAIADQLADRTVSLAADAMALRPRHETALRAACEALEDAGRPGVLDRAELAAASLRTALDQLGHLAGDVTPDDVLGRIFASFCVGK